MNGPATSRLLLDVGNSRLKWAIAKGREIGPAVAVVHHGDPVATLEKIPLTAAAGVEAIWLANVSGAAQLPALSERGATRFGKSLKAATSRASQNGLRSGYRTPAQLGVDRWLAMLAGWARFGDAFAVVGAGTAITYDAVDATGQHLGGIIAPGLMSLQQSTIGATRFPASSPEARYTEGLGDDSDSCVRQGALHAAAGLVDRLGRHLGNAPLLLAGGDALLLQKQLDRRSILTPDLVLEGLALYAELDSDGAN